MTKKQWCVDVSQFDWRATYGTYSFYVGCKSTFFFFPCVDFSLGVSTPSALRAFPTIRRPRGLYTRSLYYYISITTMKFSMLAIAAAAMSSGVNGFAVNHASFGVRSVSVCVMRFSFSWFDRRTNMEWIGSNRITRIIFCYYHQCQCQCRCLCYRFSGEWREKECMLQATIIDEKLTETMKVTSTDMHAYYVYDTFRSSRS